VLRKTIVEERGQLCLGQDYRYFFYVTNDRTMTPEEVVREANQRCNQENLHAQLKGGVRALRAPLNTLHANWAYMAIVAIAWSLKAWFALILPVAPRWRVQHEADRERVLRMEFRSFVQRFILVPLKSFGQGENSSIACWRGALTFRSSSACSTRCNLAVASWRTPARVGQLTQQRLDRKESHQDTKGGRIGTNPNPPSVRPRSNAAASAIFRPGYRLI
jgi:hypothetical protein